MAGASDTPELPREWPTVTCVITTFNYSGYVVEAIDSVLDQDYPPELLDLVVVDDGSTDDTADVLAERYGSEPRVRLIQQENQGSAGAMNTALEAVSGELVAVLDGDDAWLPGRLRAQVALLGTRPEVGLVYGDMEIVDGDGISVHPSFFAYNGFVDPPRGNVLLALLRGPNFVNSSAAMFRASMLPYICPIPDLPAQDWYLAARVAERALLDRVQTPVTRYRIHGANKGGGSAGRKFFVKVASNVRLQRWMLEHLNTAMVGLDGLSDVVSIILVGAQRAAYELETLPAELLAVDPEERTRSHALTAEASMLFRQGAFEPAGRMFVAALALDPWNGEAQAALAVARAALDRESEELHLQSAPIATRSVAVLAFADELLAAPEMLSAYCAAVDSRADVTLLIQASGALTESVADRLAAAVAAAGLDSPDAADLLLHDGDDVAAVLAAPVRAIYSRREAPGPFATLPRIDDTSLHELPAALAA
jgi:Glycosyl transferase family 2